MGGKVSKSSDSLPQKASKSNLPPYSTIAGNREGVITRVRENENEIERNQERGEGEEKRVDKSLDPTTNGTSFIYYSTLKSLKKQGLNSMYVVKTDHRHKDYQEKLLYIRGGQEFGAFD